LTQPLCESTVVGRTARHGMIDGPMHAGDV